MDEFVKSTKADLEESRRFFSNANKSERERWVLNTFLPYIKPETDPKQVVASCQEPDDVCYEGHGFQIKEIVSPGRKRGQEYEDKCEAITEQTQMQDLFKQCNSMQIPLDEKIPYVLSELKRHREKYGAGAADINVLVYLNLTDSDIDYDKTPLDYSASGMCEIDKWKSVSLVSNNHAVVLACRDENNTLLYPLIGKMFNTRG